MNSRVAVVFASSLLVLVAACSGASQSELFLDAPAATELPNEPAPKTSNGSSGSQGISGSSGSNSTSGDVGSSGNGGSSGTSGANGTSGGSSGTSGGSSGTSGGSSGTSGGSSGTSGGSSGGYNSPGIFCGEAAAGGGDLYCASPLICCAHTSSSPGGDSYECISNGIAACATGTAIRCDDRSDCPSGQVCCGNLDQTFGYKSVQCQPTCNGSPLPNVTTVRFCDPYAPVDECVEIGKKCGTSGSLDGFHVCK